MPSIHTPSRSMLLQSGRPRADSSHGTNRRSIRIYTASTRNEPFPMANLGTIIPRQPSENDQSEYFSHNSVLADYVERHFATTPSRLLARSNTNRHGIREGWDNCYRPYSNAILSFLSPRVPSRVEQLIDENGSFDRDLTPMDVEWEREHLHLRQLSGLLLHAVNDDFDSEAESLAEFSIAAQQVLNEALSDYLDPNGQVKHHYAQLMESSNDSDHGHRIIHALQELFNQLSEMDNQLDDDATVNDDTASSSTYTRTLHSQIHSPCR